MRTSSGRMTEEVPLERLQELVAHERLDLLGSPVLLEHTHIVLERCVRRVESVFELVPLEDVVVATRFLTGPVLRIYGASHGPQRTGLPLDPDHDPLFCAGVVDPGEQALGKASGG